MPILFRFQIVVLFPAVCADVKFLCVNRLVLVRVDLVAALHFPRLDEVLDDLLERALGMFLTEAHYTTNQMCAVVVVQRCCITNK